MQQNNSLEKRFENTNKAIFDNKLSHHSCSNLKLIITKAVESALSNPLFCSPLISKFLKRADLLQVHSSRYIGLKNKHAKNPVFSYVRKSDVQPNGSQFSHIFRKSILLNSPAYVQNPQELRLTQKKDYKASQFFTSKQFRFSSSALIFPSPDSGESVDLSCILPEPKTLNITRKVTQSNSAHSQK